MRRIIKEFVAVAARHLTFPDPIYELGALQVEGQEGFADLRPLFADHTYVGCDMRAGAGVDQVLDLHVLNLPDASVGSMLLLDTLEHVEFCRQALAEVYRVLQPGGMVVASSVMDFVIHAHPNDYWRFTPEGFRSLFREFEAVEVGWAGRADHPHTITAIACKGPLAAIASPAFRAAMETWRQRSYSVKRRSWSQRWLPPALYRLDRRIAKRWRSAQKSKVRSPRSKVQGS